jgi:23S rRNA-/tRNA-specific pseudouridylate synthase
LSEYLLNPIINDTLYRGRKEKEAGEAIFLHAFGLKIKSKEIIEEVFKVTKKGLLS